MHRFIAPQKMGIVVRTMVINSIASVLSCPLPSDLLLELIKFLPIWSMIDLNRVDVMVC